MKKLLLIIVVLAGIFVALFWNNIFSASPQDDSCDISTPECIVDTVKNTKDRALCDNIDEKNDLRYTCMGFGVKSLEDLDVCMTYSTSRAKNLCKDAGYFELSQYSQILEHCYWIGDQTFQAFCVGEFAQRNADVSLCDDFSDEKLQCTCYDRYLSDTSEETCNALPDGQNNVCLQCIDMI